MRIHWCRFLSGFPFRSFRRKPEERIRFLPGYRLPDPRTVLTSMAPTYRSPGNRGILRIHHRGHMLWCSRSPGLPGYTHPLHCNRLPPMVPRNMSRCRHALYFLFHTDHRMLQFPLLSLRAHKRPGRSIPSQTRGSRSSHCRKWRRGFGFHRVHKRVRLRIVVPLECRSRKHSLHPDRLHLRHMIHKSHRTHPHRNSALHIGERSREELPGRVHRGNTQCCPGTDRTRLRIRPRHMSFQHSWSHKVCFRKGPLRSIGLPHRFRIDRRSRHLRTLFPRNWVGTWCLRRGLHCR